MNHMIYIIAKFLTTDILKIFSYIRVYQLYLQTLFLLCFCLFFLLLVFFPLLQFKQGNFKGHLKLIFVYLVPHRLLVFLDSGLGHLKICHKQVLVTLILASLLLKEVNSYIKA